MRRSVFCLFLACGAIAQSAEAEPTSPPGPGSRQAAFAFLLKREADRAGLPVGVADAVMAIESGYDPTRIGGVGEIGLMQVRPATAAMLGFGGDAAELARPDVNIHFGVAYLAGAWRRAGGDLCRALMKYRAGHGEEAMTAKSVTYCERAKAHLARSGLPLAGLSAPVGDAAQPGGDHPHGLAHAARPALRLRGAAFWVEHDRRIRAMSARIERRWRWLASR